MYITAGPERLKLSDMTEGDVSGIISMTKENMAHVIKATWGLEWSANFEKKYLDMLVSTGAVKSIYDDNKLAGYLWFEERKGKNDIFINSMQLKKEYQGRGIGTQILKWLEVFALDRKRQYLSLSVQVNNQRAVTFYQGFGFGEVYRGQGSIYMSKKINRDATYTSVSTVEFAPITLCTTVNSFSTV
ncbi:MAG: GNAT family N-acetyltransferase [Candidatus Methanoperedens sp.]|nr:GNAT family N-acetyltransferase [Candidatus Methanoperedens sp.]